LSEQASPAAARLPPIDDLNALPLDGFVAAMAPFFEGAPRFLGRLAADRPFPSYADLWPRSLVVARALSEDEQLELINAHPRLGAPPATVSAMSFREQGYRREAVETEAADAEAAEASDAVAVRVAEAESTRVATELGRLNAAYEARFGFRFCVFVAGRSRQALLPVIEAALLADRPTEIRRALGDVVAIAADRARTLVR
jgi:2-oxo-4-hydroxy-4-carboxy-5-ureidoimidazoline decarboxylase